MKPLRLPLAALALSVSLILPQVVSGAAKDSPAGPPGYVIKLPPVVVSVPKEPGPELVVFELAEVDQEPRLRSPSPPTFPAQQKFNALSARATIRYVVGPTGKTGNVEATEVVLIDPATNRDLDRAQLEIWIKEGRLPGRTRRATLEEISLEFAAEFGKEAVKTVQRWGFEPGREKGLPVSTRMTTQITFAMPQRPDPRRLLLPNAGPLR